MSAKKKPVEILAYDHEDRDVPPAREFKPCSTCRYKLVNPADSAPFCIMFGNMLLWDARGKFCGRYGDAHAPKDAPEPKMPSVYAAWPMVDRVLG